MKKPFTRFLVFLFIVTLVTAQDAFADWKVYYTGKAGQMFGTYGRGSFSSKSQCESARISRPGFESRNSYCSGFDPPKPYVAPAPTNRPSSGKTAGGQVQQTDPAVLEAQRKQEEEAAKQRAQVAAMEQAAAVLQQQQFDKGKSTLANDLRNRLNASGGTNGQSLSDCWAARAGQAAQRGDRAGAKTYADYSIAAREGKSVPACQAGQSPAVPMLQGVTIIDDEPVRRLTEEKRQLDTRIATLTGKREEARTTVKEKRAEVVNLEKVSRSTADPKKKEETDALLAEAKKALAEAQEEDRRATDEINRAQNELKTVNEAMARAEQSRPGSNTAR